MQEQIVRPTGTLLVHKFIITGQVYLVTASVSSEFSGLFDLRRYYQVVHLFGLC